VWGMGGVSSSIIFVSKNTVRTGHLVLRKFEQLEDLKLHVFRMILSPESHIHNSNIFGGVGCKCTDFKKYDF